MMEEHKLEMQELQKDNVRQQREKWWVIWQSLGKTWKEKIKPLQELKWNWKKHQGDSLLLKTQQGT